MTPVAVAAVTLLVLVAVGAALAAYRRRRALHLGDPYPQNIYPGLRWAAILRTGAAITAMVLLTVIGMFDPSPLVHRLFPDADAAGQAYITGAFHEVMALSVVCAAGFAAAADVIVTFVHPTVLRRTLMWVCTLGVLGGAVYGGLFVYALSVS